MMRCVLYFRSAVSALAGQRAVSRFGLRLTSRNKGHAGGGANHESVRRLVVLLVKPSRYDDDGYVVHHWKGVLTSNTLHCMYALTLQAAADFPVPLTARAVDETVELVVPERLVRAFRGRRTMILAAIVGVQTNQFPRAADLARRFRKAGCQVIMGGFHLSGTLKMLGVTAELQELLDNGVSIFAGEAEGRWRQVLGDALRGEMKPLYNFLSSLPDLSRPWPIPLLNPTLARRYFAQKSGTIDTSRGCPWRCSFCTIINVQGNYTRSRDPRDIVEAVRRNYERGMRYYFLTDDNLARNKFWREIFAGLTQLRNEGMDIHFMMQVDTLAYKIPGFVEEAKKAGCWQVFIGLESLNPANLQASGKLHNKVEDFQEMVQAWRDAGALVHTSYIIGFPFDTPESIERDMRTVREHVRPDLASFFIMTPLPGSEDHKNLVRSGAQLDPDFNNYDSFHPVSRHPNMSACQWLEAYNKAWRDFFSIENLKAVLNKAHPAAYRQAFLNALWHAYSFLVEEAPPMATGFLRLKGRTERRPGLPREGRLAYAGRRLKDSISLVRGLARLFLMFEELWLATRGRAQIDQWLRGHMPHMPQMPQMPQLNVPELSSVEPRSLDLPRLSAAGLGLRAPKSAGWRMKLEGLRRRLAAMMISPALPFYHLPKSRLALESYWQDLGTRVARWQIWHPRLAIDLLQLPVRVVQEARLGVAFTAALLSRLY